jgi:hypothetical protein
MAKASKAGSPGASAPGGGGASGGTTGGATGRSTGAQPDTSSRARKQAVVVVHGMGEQRPMETLRDFVKSVWIEDDEFCLLAQDKTPGLQFDNKNIGKGTWITPVSSADDLGAAASENIRITTGFHVHGDKERARTDFFELYWADIMNGNASSTLRRWALGLFIRSPTTVPNDVYALWVALWIAMAAVLFLLLLAYPSFLPFGGSWLAEFGDGIINGIAGRIAGSGADQPVFWLAIAAVLNLTLFGRVWWINFETPAGDLRKSRLFPVVAHHLAVFGIMAAAILLVREIGHASATAASNAAKAAACQSCEPVAAVREEVQVIASILSLVAFGLAGAIVYVVKAFVVPYFGDVARYVQSATDTVRHREEIRQRGLALLRALHDNPSYDRVIVFSHSLGTVVAYDLIRLFWAEYGATAAAGVSLGEKARDAMLKVGEAGKPGVEWRQWSFGDIRDYRAAQKQAFLALRDQQTELRDEARAKGWKKHPKIWKISDFVTVGSPLTHADFLLARTEEQLEDMQHERTLPINPPVLEEGSKVWPENEKSFLYWSRIDEERGDVDDNKMVHTHHAAPFSVVRWTNIHDWRKWAVFGDFVSGPLRHHFGPGILDYHVNMRWESRKLPPNRLVTHTQYWAQWSSDEWGLEINPRTGLKNRLLMTSRIAGHSGEEAKPYDYPRKWPIHLRLLRAAVDLRFGKDVAVDSQALVGVAPNATIEKIVGTLRSERKGEFLAGYTPPILLAIGAAVCLFSVWAVWKGRSIKMIWDAFFGA